MADYSNFWYTYYPDNNPLNVGFTVLILCDCPTVICIRSYTNAGHTKLIFLLVLISYFRS